MSMQSLLAKAGMRTGVLGSSANLAVAFALAAGNLDPAAATDASRMGLYADRTGGSEKIGIVVLGTESASITQNGVLVPNGSQSTPSLGWQSDPDTGFFKPGANAIAVTTGGSQQMWFFADGGVQMGGTYDIIYSPGPHILNINNASTATVFASIIAASNTTADALAGMACWSNDTFTSISYGFFGTHHDGSPKTQYGQSLDGATEILSDIGPGGTAKPLFLGTGINAQPIIFGTTGTERVRIYDDGGVQFGGTFGTSPGTGKISVLETVFTANLDLPLTSADSVDGVIYMGSGPWMHAYGGSGGYENIFLGNGSGNFTNTGNDLVALGQATLRSVTNATQLVAVGKGAMQYNTSGSNNVGVGWFALNANITGENNTAVGSYAQLNQTIGDGNCSFGAFSFPNTGGASLCNAFGAGALYNTTGDNNTGFGHEAGQAIVAGTDNTFLGFRAGKTGPDTSFSTVIGSGAVATGDHQIVLGTAAETVICLGKLTVAGLIDPTGLALTPVAANPGGALAASTIWSNSTAGDALYYGASAIGGGGGTPGGANTQIQFNDSGAFGGDAGLTFIKATGKLNLAGLTLQTLSAGGQNVLSIYPSSGGNEFSTIRLHPTGTNTLSSFEFSNSSDLVNFSRMLGVSGSNGSYIASDKTGTGTAHPLVFRAGADWSSAPNCQVIGTNGFVAFGQATTNQAPIADPNYPLQLGENGSELFFVDPSGNGAFFNDLNVGGKLTVTGLIDPTGLALTPVAANPGGGLAASTIWSNSTDSNRLYYGAAAVGGTIGGTIASQQVAFGSATDTIGGDSGFTVDQTGGGLFVGIGISASSSTHLGLAASTTSASSLRLAHGVAPTTPVDGDVWTTTTAMFVRINGATVQLGAGTVTGSGANTRVAFWTSASALGSNSGFTYTTSAQFLQNVQTVGAGGGSSNTSAFFRSTRAPTGTVATAMDGLESQVDITGSGAGSTNTGVLNGFSAAAANNMTGGSTALLRGATLAASGAGSGSTTTTIVGAYCSAALSSGHTSTDMYGCFVHTSNGGTLTNLWGVYQDDTAAVNFFAGIVAVGNATASASTALMTPASSTTVSSLRMPHGSAPTSPVNGDVWTTTSALFVRINGATVQLGSGSISGAVTTGQIPYASATNTLSSNANYVIDVTGGDAFVGIGVAASTSTHLVLAASTAAASSLRIPAGLGPSAPVNGDIWTTNSGFFVRINSVTNTVLVGSIALNQVPFGSAANTFTGLAAFTYIASLNLLQNAQTVTSGGGGTFQSLFFTTTRTQTGNSATSMVAGEFQTDVTGSSAPSTNSGVLSGVNATATNNMTNGTTSDIRGATLKASGAGVGSTSLAITGAYCQATVTAGHTATDLYGCFIHTASAGTLTNRWGLYQDDTSAKNFFAGIVAVGNATASATTALIVPASTTGVSSLRIPHGAAPTSPVNGDVWTTTTAMFVRINGATVQLGSGTIGGSIAATQVAIGSGTNTVSGDATLTYDGATLANTQSTSSAIQVIVNNTSAGNAATATVALGSDTGLMRARLFSSTYVGNDSFGAAAASVLEISSNAATIHFGTVTNAAISVYTNSTEKLRVFGNGGVQIGGTYTTGPGAGALQASGSITSNSTAAGAITSNGDVQLLKAAATDAQMLIQVASFGSVQIGVNNSGSTNAAGALTGGMYVGSNGAFPLYLTTGGVIAVTVSAGADVTVAQMLTVNGVCYQAAGLRQIKNSYSGNQTLTTANLVAEYTANGTTDTFTLPTSPATGTTLVVKNSGTGILSVAGGGGNTIDGSGTARSLATKVAETYCFAGSGNWIVV